MYTAFRLIWYCVLLSVLMQAGCASMENYEESTGPLFTGEYAPTHHPFDGTLKVITWNIKFGNEVETAIAELASTPVLADADLLLLQEMDADGVDTLAQTLSYNYVYYPASLHSRHGKDFGNAVLSKWPLVDTQKLLLPNENWRNGQRRIAVQGVTDIDGLLVDLYSVHTETPWMGAVGRNEQIDTVVAETETEPGPAIVGGDFNTLTPQSRGRLDKRFADAGFKRVSSTADPTLEVGVGFSVDHIYARGFTIEENGVWPETEASDHFPVWAVLRTYR